MAAITQDGRTFKEVFLENTHLADSQRQVKKYILIRTPAEINKLRRCYCPRITYENRQCPGEFKTKLCADDIALGRYKYVPVKYPTEMERNRILRKRQKQQQRSLIKTPRILLENDEDDSEEMNNDDNSENDADEEEEEEDTFNVNSDNNSPGPKLQLSRADMKGLKAMRKWHKKALTVESDNSSDDDDSSTVSGEYKEYLDKLNRQKVLTSPDFDTDFESSDESIREQYIDAKGRFRRKRLSKTVKDYYWACARYHMTPVRSFVRQCGKATVDIRYRMLNYKDARPIAITLVNDKKTSFLDISFNPLGPNGTSIIAQMLSQNDYIVELNLSSTFPQREGLLALLEALSKNHTLHRLYLDDNELLPSDGEVIADMIIGLPALLELHLANNNLGGDGAKKIAQALGTSKGKLNVLNLRYNNIRTDAAMHVAMSLVKNKTLRSLNLSWNGFGAEGTKALSMALQKNNTLKDLDLTCNRIGIKSLDVLIEGLVKNKGLLCLRVASNPLTTEGVKVLVEAITAAKTSTLSELDLRGIPVDEEFFELKDKLVEARTIRVHHEMTLNLATTDLSREGDGTFLDNYDPVLVMFEFMKKDNLRVIDFFQFFDVRKRDKLSKSDFATGFTILMIPFTQHHIDMIMKKLDRNKDGFISIDEMAKGYTRSDKQVKIRRIKASKKKIKDEGLETLWVYLKSLIDKRKEENTLKTAISSEMRRSSLLPGANNKRGSIFPGADGSRKGSLFPGSPTGRLGSLLPTGGDGGSGRRGSLFQAAASLVLGGADGGRRGSGSDSRRGSLLLAAAAAGLMGGSGGSNSRRGSLFPMMESPVNLSRRGSSGSLVDVGSISYGTDRRGSGVVTATQGRPDMILEDEDSSVHVDDN